MTIHISLSPEQESLLRRRAAEMGKDVETFAREAVEEKLAAPGSFAEILGPVHDQTERAGTTEEELDEFIETTRDEVHAERRRRGAI